MEVCMSYDFEVVRVLQWRIGDHTESNMMNGDPSDMELLPNPWFRQARTVSENASQMLSVCHTHTHTHTHTHISWHDQFDSLTQIRDRIRTHLMKQLWLQKACVLALAVAPIWQWFLLPNHSKVWAEFQLFLQMIKAIYTYLLANIIEICATPVTFRWWENMSPCLQCSPDWDSIFLEIFIVDVMLSRSRGEFVWKFGW